jgi:type VI secretion system protein ImpM
MLGFVKRAVPAADLGCGLFGKVISSGDFISVGEYSPAAAHLSRWLEQGVGWAATQAKAAWESVDFSAPRAFLFRADRSEPSDRVLFGLLQPSRDTVGRRFPLAVYGELALGSDFDSFSALPLVVGEFLESAAGILEQVPRGVDPRQLLNQLPQNVSFRLASAKSEYSDWAASTPISAVLASTFPGDSLSMGSTAICALHDIISPFIGRDYPATPLSVRLPLGAAGIAGAVFWLELMRRTLRWKRTVPICFWHAYSDSGQLVVPIGDPSMRSLLGLWVANDLDDSHCDLTTNAVCYGEVPPAVSTALANDVTVAQFMAGL